MSIVDKAIYRESTYWLADRKFQPTIKLTKLLQKVGDRESRIFQSISVSSNALRLATLMNNRIVIVYYGFSLKLNENAIKDNTVYFNFGVQTMLYNLPLLSHC